MLMYGFVSFIYVDAKFMLSLSEAISFCHETDAKSYDILNHGQWVYNVRKSFRIAVLALYKAYCKSKRKPKSVFFIVVNFAQRDENSITKPIIQTCNRRYLQLNVYGEEYCFRVYISYDN